ncbi:MAG: thiamine phosphate synthase [Proteobacteria bacterium]|nr:thiamine phosphate synthase [Pseudomonadota bacterium]
MLPSLYLITDRHQTGGRPLIEVVEEALKGGARLVQLREKDLSGRELHKLALQMRELTNRYDAKLLINERADIAAAAGADGVHLPEDSFSLSDVRRLIGPDAIVGVSTHSMEAAKKAEEEGADFITFSPIYETPSKMQYGAPQGLDKLEEVCRNTHIPIYALGGIKKNNIAEVIQAGVNGVAMISAVLNAEDVKGETEKIMSIAPLSILG